jgi:hypothetical protein
MNDLIIFYTTPRELVIALCATFASILWLILAIYLARWTYRVAVKWKEYPSEIFVSLLAFLFMPVSLLFWLIFFKNGDDG